MRKFQLTIKGIGEFILAAMILIAWQQSASAGVTLANNETQLAAAPKLERSLKSDSEHGTMYPTTPTVGSQEWKKEQDENELKEKRLKAIMQGICKGC